jgi:hypothetical protein
VTATTAELNILDGVTATASELNALDGVTWTLTDYNTLTSTAAELNVLDGITASTAELNILDGVTATASEINALDGVTATGTAVIQAADAAAARTAISFNDGLNATGSAPVYACRAWARFDGNGTSLTGGNVSSVTKNGTGDYYVNFSTPMPDSFFNAIASVYVGGFIASAQPFEHATNRVRIQIRGGANQLTDGTIISVSVFR